MLIGKEKEMPAAKNKKSRIGDMTSDLYEYLDAGATDENGDRPEGLDELEGFLSEFVDKVVDANSVRCPLVQPSDDRRISLKWQDREYASYADVNLLSREAECVVVGGGKIMEQIYCNLDSDSPDWEELSEKVSQWV